MSNICVVSVENGPAGDPGWHRGTMGCVTGIALCSSANVAPRQPRVQNGSCGKVTDIDDKGAVTVALDGSARKVTLVDEGLAFHNVLHQLVRILDRTPGIGGLFKTGITMPVQWSGSGSEV